MEIKIINGDTVNLSGRAWWLNGALESKAGIAVARIHAESTTLRYPSNEQLAANKSLNRYWVDAGNAGSFQTLMLDLTEQDLIDYNIIPGILTSTGVVDGTRPKTNTLEKVISKVHHQQSQDWLKNDCIGKPSDY